MNRSALILLCCGFAAASCGGGGTPSADTASTNPPATDVDVITTEEAPTTTIEPEPTTIPGPAAVDSLEGVRAAVVRIVVTGSFADPFDGVQTGGGSGSGFIIDPSGIAVTNNHVVTGAALLEVYVNDEERPRNARVLAVSECSDLAVIQIDGDDFDYLEWYDGSPTAGMEIFAAGFPLGDSEYTVLDGIISKEDANGDHSWASVDAVIEHSADTLPGSSGGPIVTRDGKVVGIEYAGNELGQEFAIGLDVARPVVETLAAGTDLDTIGVNGEALFDGFETGVWVYSVKSGSPADVAGVKAGDLVTTMEGVTLADDGTLADYCDILRSHVPTDVLSISVYRADTDELLEGQLNGRALEVITSFAAEFDDTATDDTFGFEYTDYTMITDDSGLITLSVPVEWSDVSGLAWNADYVPGEEMIGPALSASPDRQAWLAGWDTPGVFIGASPLIPLTVEELLNEQQFTESCFYDDRYPYDDGVYTGLFDVWTDCGGSNSQFFVVVVEPADQTWLGLVQIIVVTDADLDAADEIFNTFLVSDLGG